ncbi:THAP domain-containing protein 1-like [Tachypleus tridentatus]|uniref:THAP domain-containing protein 1-like n=1 Tax=Tachypleus tridentatus TaxID=6853 RepID=UPI003FCF331F
MVTTCVAVACQDRQDRDPGKNFHRFPTDPGRRSRWIAAVKREGWQPTSASRVSSDHFILSKNDDFLSPDYVPLQFQYVFFIKTSDIFR